MDKKNILILEDEKDIARIYAKCLNDKGYNAEFGFNGLEGLEKLRNFTPHLILLDVNMPGMGGLEFYQRICGADGRPKYPVLVLTARADLETLFRDFQVDGILIKPFAASQLFKEVDIILNKHHWEKTDGGGRKVTIVEDIFESARKIKGVFADGGYKTEVADSGMAAIEMMMNDPPDLAVVKLGLFDMPGEKVIARLQQIARTRRTSVLLYIPYSNANDKSAMESIAAAMGIRHRLAYDTPVDLLKAANGIFQGLESNSSTGNLN
ncbi:MAG: response regulator [Candidatus Omnitrophica bacterium]|nr:response regulator [Candidatus Omnitrophota bacterium]MDE2008686.1 response regulator [Candidatus Omnitrophota bacterium]MDE2214827.1 response regulator [Candidatus Omnitrophota bacterium]MDE2231947.1 response regulator [Candidatus Omnitrophota bacterium]